MWTLHEISINGFVLLKSGGVVSWSRCTVGRQIVASNFIVTKIVHLLHCPFGVAHIQDHHTQEMYFAIA